MRELDHPNLVSIYDFFQDDPKYYYMVLELMSGGELFDRIVQKVSSDRRFHQPGCVRRRWAVRWCMHPCFNHRLQGCFRTFPWRCHLQPQMSSLHANLHVFRVSCGRCVGPNVSVTVCGVDDSGVRRIDLILLFCDYFLLFILLYRNRSRLKVYLFPPSPPP